MVPDPGTTNQPVWTPDVAAEWLTLTAQHLEDTAHRLRCHALIRQVPDSGLVEMLASVAEIWNFYSDSEEVQP